MSVDYVALTAELAAGHPVTGAYSADAQVAADQLNAANIDVIRDSMSGAEIFAATDPAEYAALADGTGNNNPDTKAQWLSFCAIESHDPAAGGLAQQFVVSIFGGGSQTVANLAALRTVQVSRAQQIGFGRSVTADHVRAARGEV